MESDAILTVKFHMNPVSNFTVYWSMGGLWLQNTHVKNTVTEEHIETTYFIRKVTNQHLGNYTVHVINCAIASEHNEAAFNVILKLKDKKGKTSVCTVQCSLAWSKSACCTSSFNGIKL